MNLYRVFEWIDCSTEPARWQEAAYASKVGWGVYELNAAPDT